MSLAKSSTTKSTNAKPGTPQEATEAPPNLRILIVEDEPEIAESYKAILQPQGTGSSNVVPLRRSSRGAAVGAESTPKPTGHPAFEVTVCSNAEDALKAVKEATQKGQPFAMGFFDVLLGAGIDGIELVRQIHEMDTEMYAVFVTAYHDRSVDSINEILGPGMADHWDYLNKPFSEGEIVQKARMATTLWNLKRRQDQQENVISEAKQRLFENERMSAVAVVSRGVGHEFGNILLQIMGRAELSQNGSPEEMKRALGTILKASETASHILDKFKDLAKPSERKLQKSQIQAKAPLDEALELMSHQLKTKNIRVVWIKGDKVSAYGCHNSMVQVFVNFIINAIHVMEGGGQIDLSVRQDGDFVEYKFRDYGPGVPDHVLPRIAEAFFTTKGDLGTGLGLSISREIIEIEHRGELKFQNHPMKGLEITARIPVQASEEDHGS